MYDYIHTHVFFFVVFINMKLSWHIFNFRLYCGQISLIWLALTFILITFSRIWTHNINDNWFWWHLSSLLNIFTVGFWSNLTGHRKCSHSFIPDFLSHTHPNTLHIHKLNIIIRVARDRFFLWQIWNEFVGGNASLWVALFRCSLKIVRTHHELF